MSSQRIREILSDKLPEWQFSTIERVDMGQHSAYRLSLSGRQALFKYDGRVQTSPHVTRKEEAKIQRVAASRGLAPGVFHADDECIMTEYVDAEVLSESQLRQHDTIIELVRKLHELHRLPPSDKMFDGSTAAHSLAATIQDKVTASRCVAAVEALPEPEFVVFSHNDLTAGNILRGQEILFIDWEYACNNSPMFDLATLVAHHGLDAEAVAVLIEHYYGRCEDSLLAELAVYERAYHALHWLWLASRDPNNHVLSDLAAEINS